MIKLSFHSFQVLALSMLHPGHSQLILLEIWSVWRALLLNVSKLVNNILSALNVHSDLK